jgi:integrase
MKKYKSPKIEQLPSGSYRVRLYYGKDATGKKVIDSVTDPDIRKIKRVISEYEQSQMSESFDTFETDAYAYIRSKKAVLSPYTVKTYEVTVDILKRSYSRFCALKTYHITSESLQDLINDLVEQGKSPKYIRNTVGFIKSVIKSTGKIPPVVTLPEAKRPDLHEPTTEEIKKIIDAARGSALEIPILLAVHGLRRGEICALRYPEDFDDNIAHIRRSAVYLGKGKRQDKTPKNQQSDRFVPIAPDVMEKIRKKGYIYRGQPQTLTGSFRKFLTRNDLPIIRFHDIRHYFASYLHDQGIPDAEVMKLGGWATDYVMKRVYRYALDPEHTRVQSLISNVVSTTDPANP